MAYVMVAIGGLTAFNMIQQGNAAKMQGELSAQQSEAQGKVEMENALETARIIRKAGRRQVGAAVAGYAASGVRVDQGSAVDVQEQITKDVAHDAYQTLLDGNRRASGLITDAAMSRASGRMQQASYNAGAVGSVLQAGYGGMRAGGWRTAGPGFSGQQAPAPVETRVPVPVGS